MKSQKFLLIIIVILIIFICTTLFLNFGIKYINFYFTSKPWTMTATIEKISQYDKHFNILAKRESDSGLYRFSVNKHTKLIYNNKTIHIEDLQVGQKIVITSRGNTIIETFPASLEWVTKIEILDN